MKCTKCTENLRIANKRRPSSAANPFYGYTAKVIAEVCGVSIGTAEHYKAGRRKPPTPTLRLFCLHRDGKVLSDKAWKRYKIVQEKLFLPNGRFVTESHILYLELMCQMLKEADPEGYEVVTRTATRA